MTQKQVTTKPRYIEIDGPTGLVDLSVSSPPFEFRGVTGRIFPIKANMSQLYRFCDKYLNMDVPDTIVQFRPALPYVYLMVINYGSMAAASTKGPSVGWVAQREVTFTVPLERWVRDPQTQEFRFVDWASVTPFIFVDDELSLITGREVYGWPKVAAEVQPSVPLWAGDPRAPTRLFTLRTSMFPSLFEGAREQMMDLIDIERDSVPRFSEAPPDLDNPWNPLWIFPTAAANGLGLLGQAADLLWRLPARGYRHGWNLASVLGMSRAAASSLVSALPDWAARLPEAAIERWERNGSLARQTQPGARRPLGMDTVTLKQFRDTQDPAQACYQALVNARMTIEQVNGCGLLGDYNFLRGDPSGGYAIRLHRSNAQPIVESLGLNVVRTERGPFEKIDILKPTLPFWTDVDIRYAAGEVICERAQCFDRRGSCRPEWISTLPTCSPAPQITHPERAEAETKIFYNTLQGAGTQAVTGPFNFPDLTAQIYPLPTEDGLFRDLQDFLDHYLNGPLNVNATNQEAGHSADLSGYPRYEFKACEPYVYLTTSVLGDQAGIMWSESNNIGWWADKEVSVCMLVKVYRLQHTIGANRKIVAERRFKGLGLVYPYVFSNSSRAVITDRETVGRPTVRADIESPPDVWMTAGGPAAPRELLRLSTDTFPTFYLGQEAVRGTLIEIREDEPVTGGCEADSDAASARPQPLLIRWLGQTEKRKPRSAKASKRKGGAIIDRYHIKQYRDAAKIETACYQALVKTELCVTEAKLPREQKDRGLMTNHPVVLLNKTPAFPIVENLKLDVSDTSVTPGGVMQVLHPTSPLWMRIALREQLGEVLCWRTTNGNWTYQ